MASSGPLIRGGGDVIDKIRLLVLSAALTSLRWGFSFEPWLLVSTPVLVCALGFLPDCCRMDGLLSGRFFSRAPGFRRDLVVYMMSR